MRTKTHSYLFWGAACLAAFFATVIKTACTQMQQPETLLEIRTDTLKIHNPNGPSAELMLGNSTRHLTNGLLTNIDTNGLTQFRKLDLVPVGTTGLGIVGQDTILLDKLQYYLSINGGTVGTTDILTTNAHKLKIGMYSSGTGHSNAPKAIDYNGVYLGLGYREYGANTYRAIGFGYVGQPTDNYPGVVGYQEINTSGYTFGDLIFATRPNTSNIAPTVRMRITASGAIKSYTNPEANEDVATKFYVDSIPIKHGSSPHYTAALTESRTLFVTGPTTGWLLPKARPGLMYSYFQPTTQAMSLTPMSTDYLIDSLRTSKKGGAMTASNSPGNFLTVVAVSDSTWLVTQKVGTWTLQTN